MIAEEIPEAETTETESREGINFPLKLQIETPLHFLGVFFLVFL